MSWYNSDDAITVAKEGWYPAVVDGAEMTTSKNGMRMQKLGFKVFVDGKAIKIFDYFHSKNLWKYYGLAKSMGQGEQFKAEEFDAANNLGEPFEVYLIIEESDQYGDQNKINKFAMDKSNTPGVPVGASTAPVPHTQPQGQAVGGYEPIDPVTAISHDDIPF